MASDEAEPVAYLLRQIDAEAERRRSLDQRTVGVLSGTAALVAIAFGLTKVDGSLQRYEWLEGACLIAASLSVCLSVVSSLASFAKAPNPKDLRSILMGDPSTFGSPEPTLRQGYYNEYMSRRRSNSVRSLLVNLAQLAQAASASGFLYLAWLTVR